MPFKERRWKSEAYKVYVRANMDEHELVSGVQEARCREFERQPGQGTIFSLDEEGYGRKH